MNERQERFVQEYLVDLNATQAAIRAGYSPGAAESRGRKLLKVPAVKAALEQAMAERSRKVGLSSERVLENLGRTAFFSPGDVINLQTGELLPDADPEDLQLLTKTKVKRTARQLKDGTEEDTLELEYVFPDKLRALELLMRHLGIDKPRGESDEHAHFGVVILPAVEPLPPPPD